MDKRIGVLIGAMFVASTVQVANAACNVITRDQLQTAANNVYGDDNTGGFHLNMWVTMVDETGKVCYVVTTGDSGALASRSEWLGSRVISAQKANTANAFSLNGVAISTGALYAAVQEGGSLYGLQASNPVDASRSYLGNPSKYGTSTDPLVGQRIGGVNVFGGGLALYSGGVKVGAIGVSGDTSCTDHAFAWRVRDDLGLEPGDIGLFEMLTLVDSNAYGMNGDDTVRYNSAINSTTLGEHPNCYGTGGIRYDGYYGFVDSNGTVANWD